MKIIITESQLKTLTTKQQVVLDNSIIRHELKLKQWIEEYSDKHFNDAKNELWDKVWDMIYEYQTQIQYLKDLESNVDYKQLLHLYKVKYPDSHPKGDIMETIFEGGMTHVLYDFDFELNKKEWNLTKL